MLKFAVYEGREPARDFSLQHAHLLGANDVGMQGQISFEAGVIHCAKKSGESAALALMVDAGEHGRLMLPTCLLPDQENPYLLYVELARHRLKTFLLKLEDWLLFELHPEHPVLVLWRQATDLLTKALAQERSDPPNAHATAKEALVQALTAGEQLAIMHADMLLAKRYANGQMPRRALGCRIHQCQFAEPLTRVVAETFDCISVPLRWREIEPEEGEYDWSKYDRWLEWADKSRTPVMLGPIIDFRSHSVPEWLYIWEHDYETLYDVLQEHVEAIVKRYKSAVAIWNIASSLHINESFTLAYDQLMDVTRMATGHVKTLHPAGKTLVEVTQPFGEYYAGHPKSVPPVVYAEVVAQSGFKLDFIGVNVQFGHHASGQATRDFLQLSGLLDTLLHMDFPVVLTGLGVPSHRGKTEDGQPDAAGYYREPWSPKGQAEWLRKAIALALSKPFVEAVYVHELFDHPTSELPGAGLITARGAPKPALAAMAELHREVLAGTLRCSRPEERKWLITDVPAGIEQVRK